MRIKDPNKITSWHFNLLDPEGIEVRVPAEGGLNSLHHLISRVNSYIQVYDQGTDGAYSKLLREEADKHKITFDKYISKLIQHQMCLTQPIACWSDGFGDDLHSLAGKVDSFVEKAPAPVRRIMQNAIARLTPSKARAFSSCGTCGGTRVMNPQANNLGRAGTVNRFTRR
jgi:hypothetical protein